MYATIKEIIKSKDYDLKDLTCKIKKIYLHGDLAENQCEELLKLAQDNAKFTNSFDMLEFVKGLEKRIRALESGKAPAGKDYPEYVDGKWYRNGDKVTFKNKHYECIAPEGQVCTWDPDTYPTYWRGIE